jgi:integrase
MDLRAQQYFKDEEAFHRGMKLFQQYVDAQTRAKTFDQMEASFFDQLDDVTSNDSALLDAAASYIKSKRLESEPNLSANELAASRLSELLRNSLRSTTDLPVVDSQQSPGITLKQTFSEFLESKRSEWKASGGMERDYVAVYFPLLTEICGDIETKLLTRQHIARYTKIVRRLPSNRSKKKEYKNRTFLDFEVYEAPDEDKLSPVTLKRYLSQTSTFLKWLLLQGYVENDLTLPLKATKIKTARSSDQKSLYSKSDLKKIFNSTQYTSGKHELASHFWVPLLALFTGARLNELCQLELSDITYSDELKRWLIDFNENSQTVAKKSLKRAHHTRQVPIHQVLLTLGFIDYMKSMKSKKEVRLFPELSYKSDVNKFGDQIQRWFNRTYTNERNCKITTEKTSFHSLRHTVISHLVNEKGVDANQIATAFGQSPLGGVTQKTYTKKMHARDYCKYFDMIDFSDCFEINKIKRWNLHLFNRKPRSNVTKR